MISDHPVNVLVIGQTPPPFHGQAMMIQRLVNAKFNDVKILHVRMSFSHKVSVVGRPSFGKIFHLVSIIYSAYRIRFREEDLILYYPPAGPNIVPIIRDLILLFFIKPFFYRTIYHFRAAGISDFLKSKSKVFQLICRKIYGIPDISIQLSFLNPADGAYFNSKKIFYIPNGLEDAALTYFPIDRWKLTGSVINILFVGVLREDKGIGYLIEALSILLKSGCNNFKLFIVGEFSSSQYQRELVNKITEYNLDDYISFCGLQIAEKKWEYFLKADFLCFPTFFNSESFGNVIVEAMMFQLPVIATRWRGIPDIVTEDVGFLVPINDKGTLAEKIYLLIHENELRCKMGLNARRVFLEKYTLQHHLDKMKHILLSL